MNLSYLTNLPKVHQVRAEICRRRYFEFFKEFWGEINNDELVLNWHIENLCDELQQMAERVIKREPNPFDTIINIPPGTSKSTICTIMFPTWCWVRDPSLRIISSSYSSDLATSHAVKSRDLMRSDKFLQYYGHVFRPKADMDNKTHYENDKTGSRTATSTGGTITGKHAHIIIVDDPLNPQQSASEAERKNANDYLDKTLSSRKTDKKVTATVLIMQRLHEDDPTGHWLKKKGKKIKHICLPAKESVHVSPPELRKKYENGLLDPVRLDQEVIDLAKIDLGSYGYSGQYDQRPSPDEGGKIKKAWFKKIGFEEFVKIAGPNRIVNLFADTAYTEKQKNDPTALMPACYHQNNLYIIHSEQVWKEFPDLLKHVPSYSLQYGYTNKSRIMIEPKASGLSTVQSFKNSKFNVIELPAPKDDKITRVSNVSAFIEAGRCFLIEGSWNENFLEECGSFPTGSHDDQVDNLVNAINYYQGIPTGKPRLTRT
jgi:predicted phage terminase large subunit-like protein